MEPFWGSFCSSKLVCFFLVCLTANSLVSGQTGAGTLYRGKYIGKLQARQHKVSGDVYAVDARTLHIRSFTYDGTGPDAFFWTGFTENPSPEGIIIPDENGSKAVLGAYNARDITLTLPDGLTLREVKWLSIWCRAYEVNFGDMYIPADLDFPQPHVIGSLSGQHGVTSGPIVVVDAQTILVPDFSYDGQAPDVHFWVGRGKPGPDGIRVPDETGSDTPLTKSDKKTMVLTLPGDLTIFDIDFFGVWCRLYYVDFGHVKILPGLNVPPSLRMLGVTPQTKLNCEVLWDDLALEIRWAVAGESIVMQMVGKIEDGQYMSFGLSGDDSRSVMIGGDVVVGWFDRATGRGHVVDYYLDGKSQCSGRRGTCPDSRLQAESNNVRLLSATVVNGFTMLTFQRPLLAHDELDRSILTNRSQPIIWAVGPINQREEASYHTLKNRDSIYMEFGRVPKWNCPAPDAEPQSSKTIDPSSSIKSGVVVQLSDQPRPVELGLPIQTSTTTPATTTTTTTTSRPIPQIPFKPSTSPAWNVPPILCHEPEDRVFYAQMGPTGGKRGYSAITGHVGWGIAWYINGLLVPEVHLVRGRTYTFVVEGGDNPDVAARYHPFYITDDPEGGYQYKTQAEKNAVRVFAGVGQDSTGKSQPTATGRLCQWTENNDQPADGFSSYGAYQRSLSLHCDEGHPGILHWTPDEHTPDTVYYQCFTHRYLGWKIRVLDSCDGDERGGGREPLGGGARDQELGESISHGTQTGAPLQKLLNDVKTDATGTTSTGNEGRILAQFTPTPPNPQHYQPPPSTFSDKSLVINEKQEPLILQSGGALGPQQLEPRVPDGGPYTGNTVFLRNPEVSSQQHVIISHAHTHPPLPPYTPDVRNPQLNRNSHPIRFVDAYGQRLRVGDGSRIYVENGPTPDYVLPPTRVPLVPHSGRYEGLPSMILASTVPPQILAPAPVYETRSKAEFATIQNVGHRGPEGSPLVQGSLVRLKDGRLRPDQLPLSSENVKYIEYPPTHLRVGANEGPAGGAGVRNRPSWSHSRNLPKRDELRVTGTETELPNMEQLRRSLQNLDERGDFEIIKVNDTSLLPFDLNLTTTPKSSAAFEKQLDPSISRIKSTPENSSAGTPKFYLVEDSGHGRTSEQSVKSTADGSTGVFQRFSPSVSSHYNQQDYFTAASTTLHGSRQGQFPSIVKRGPSSNFNVHDMERVSESKDLQLAANQHRAPSIIPASTNGHARGSIPRLSAAPPGTILAFDGRHLGFNNEELNFRPPADVPTQSIQNKPQFVPYRGELPNAVLELAENFPHLRGQNSPGVRQFQREPLQPSGSSSQIGNHNLIPRPQPSKLELGDDITMVYIKGTDEKELQRELPKIIRQVQKESYGREEGRRPGEPQFLPIPHSLESRGTAESEENMQIIHGQGQGYSSPSQAHQRPSAPRQDVVPANNTDLHILTDIWSIINNQDEQSSSKPHPVSIPYRAGSPQRSGLPIPTRSRPSPTRRF